MSTDPGEPSPGLWCWMYEAVKHQTAALPSNRAGLRATVLVPFNGAVAAALHSGAPLGPLPDGRPQYREEPVKSVRVFRLDLSPEDKRRGHPWERVLRLTEIVWSFRGS